MTEAQIQAAILLEFGSLPQLRIWRMNVGVAKDQKSGRIVRFGVPGMADIQGLLARGGRTLHIEVKTATGKQSEAQKKWQTMIEKMNGIYILARSTADVRAALAAYL